MLLRQISAPDLAQYAYLVACQETGHAILVDPQRDVDRYFALAAAEGVEIVAVAETHIHADFLSGAKELRDRCGVEAYLSACGGPDWRYAWATDAGGGTGAGVVLLEDGHTIDIGSVTLRALATPGHTPEHLCFVVTDRARGADDPVGILTGDFLLVDDLGRPDLLEIASGRTVPAEASARALYRSVQCLEGFADHVQIWPGHGAGSSCGRSIGAVPTSTLGYERRHNGALRRASEGEDAFVQAILADQPTPPMYFARMKRVNRAGPPPLRRLPRPRALTSAELEGIVGHGETVVVDARSDRGRFMRAHLPGALHAPLGHTFSNAVGSLVTEETRPLVLVAEEMVVERLVRDLVRMGYDRVVAFAEPAAVDEYFDAGGEKALIPVVDFEHVRTALDDPATVIVDVRDHFEFADGHIPGAVNAPYTRLPEYLAGRVPTDRRLVVHCATGARSAVAAAWLASRGREVVYVEDDWSAWAAAGGEVVRGGAADRPVTRAER